MSGTSIDKCSWPALIDLYHEVEKRHVIPIRANRLP